VNRNESLTVAFFIFIALLGFIVLMDSLSGMATK